MPVDYVCTRVTAHCRVTGNSKNISGIVHRKFPKNDRFGVSKFSQVFVCPVTRVFVKNVKLTSYPLFSGVVAGMPDEWREAPDATVAFMEKEFFAFWVGNT